MLQKIEELLVVCNDLLVFSSGTGIGVLQIELNQRQASVAAGLAVDKPFTFEGPDVAFTLMDRALDREGLPRRDEPFVANGFGFFEEDHAVSEVTVDPHQPGAGLDH